MPGVRRGPRTKTHYTACEVKLVFDHNLSPGLVRALADLYTGSVHVLDLGLVHAMDNEVWEHAREHGLTIVSKDSDFQ